MQYKHNLLLNVKMVKMFINDIINKNTFLNQHDKTEMYLHWVIGS